MPQGLLGLSERSSDAYFLYGSPRCGWWYGRSWVSEGLGEESDAGVEGLADGLLDGFGGAFVAEVVEVGGAEGALDVFKVEADVGGPGVVEGAEEVSAEGGTLEAGDAMAAPDVGDGGLGGEGLGGGLALLGDEGLEALDGAKLDSGDVLLVAAEAVGDVLVAHAGEERELDDLDELEAAGEAVLVEEAAEGVGEGALLAAGVLIAAEVAGGGFRAGVGDGELPGAFVAADGLELAGGAALAAPLEGLEAEDAEEVALEGSRRVVAGEALEEADEGVLDEVVGLGGGADAAARVGVESALVALDELRPGVLVAGADAFDEVLVGLLARGKLLTK